MKRAGVKMGLGTDPSGHHHTQQGTEFTLHSQVLNSFEIFHSAAAVNAEILRMEGKLGVVKLGCARGPSGGGWRSAEGCKSFGSEWL